MNLDSFWTWAILYEVGGCAWIGWRVAAWHDEPPITRPAALSPALFTVALVLAAVLVSPIWPLEVLGSTARWIVTKRSGGDDNDA